MNITKLPSGSYRIRQMDNGKLYCITVDHKPSKAEAIRLMAEKIEKSPNKTSNMTFEDACKAFLDAKKNIISPTTYREYTSTMKRIPDDFLHKSVYQITPMMLQKLVNDWTVNRSPKTVKNYSSFVQTVLKSADVNIKSPQLPQMEYKLPYVPTKEDIQAIAEYAKGTDMEVPLGLAVRGLRRSEIAALTPDDVIKTENGYAVNVNKALVLNANKEWVIKTTKTTFSNRTVIISEEMAHIIEKQGYILKKKPNEMNKFVHKAQDKLGIPRFSLHKYRHFYASYLYHLGYNDKQIDAGGGWEYGSVVMSKNYKHALEMEKAKQSMENDISALFDTDNP